MPATRTKTRQPARTERAGRTRPDLAAVPDKVPDWGSWRRSFVRSLRVENLTERTIGSYEESFDKVAGWALKVGIMSPEDMSQDELEDFFVWLRAQPTPRGTKVSDATVARHFRSLSVFWKWFARKVAKEHREDPDRAVSIMYGMRAPIVEEKEVPIFSDAELRRMIKACRSGSSRDVFAARRDEAIIRLLFDCGMRRAELAGLEVENLDLDGQLVTIPAAIAKNRRERTIPFGAKTAEALDDYLRVRGRHKDNRLDALWLAASPKRGAFKHDGVRQMIERRADDAGVDGAFAHRFRHTSVNARLADGGMTEGEAMLFYGWKSRGMLDKYGASVAKDRMRKAAARQTVGDRI